MTNLRNAASRLIRLLAPAMLSAAQAPCFADPGIDILAPVNGATVAPGSSVRVILQIDPTLQPTEVRVEARMDTHIPTLRFAAPPYDGYLQIPEDGVTGPVQLSAWVSTSDPASDYRAGRSSVVINVVPNAPLQNLGASSNVFLYLGMDQGDTEHLEVIGIYAGVKRRDLHLGAVGTTYTTANPLVATVSVDGIVQAIGRGHTIVTVRNGDKRALAGVTVYGPNRAPPPPLEVTSQVQIWTGGFRHDAVTSDFYQEVTVRNVSQEPVQCPLELVLSNLPNNISLVGGEPTTQILPLGSPHVRLKLTSGAHLEPAQSATALLRFRNTEGRPIAYDAKVYTALEP